MPDRFQLIGALAQSVFPQKKEFLVNFDNSSFIITISFDLSKMRL